MKRILVVDDEDSIRQSLSDVLTDEGFEVSLARDGQEALEDLDLHPVDLILLDIWLPGMDGTEILKEIKARWPSLQVIMISGHGDIDTAVKAIKLGAYDYIEKPLSLEGLLLTVKRALNEGGIGLRKPVLATEEQRSTERAKVYGKNRLRGVKGYSSGFQRTIKKSIVLGGEGLHSGRNTGLILSPLPPNSGIIFTGLSSEEMIPAQLDYVLSTDYAITLKSGHTSIMTIEHLMAVLHIYRITNLLIKTGSEVPIMDGSAIEYCLIIEDCGIEEQDEPIAEIVINSFHSIGDISNGRYISIEPSPNLTIQYSMDCPLPIGRQKAKFNFKNPEVFKKEIAPARTYGSVKEYGRLEEMGLAKGGRLSNVILIGDEKVINTPLRFTNEFARHKILDILGDLYLLGKPIKGKIIARMTGHTENIQLLKKII